MPSLFVEGYVAQRDTLNMTELAVLLKIMSALILTTKTGCNWVLKPLIVAKAFVESSL